MSERPTRRAVHLRRIHVEGYERDDGLIDIEGTLIDTKPSATALLEKTVPPDDAIHHMVLRIAIDPALNIVEAAARTVTAPYGVCGEIAPEYARLVGLRIGPGFRVAVKRLFHKVAGCTHMTEMLPAMATTAYQIVWSRPGAFAVPDDGQTALGGCHALRLDGPVVMRHFPDAARRAPRGETGE